MKCECLLNGALASRTLASLSFASARQAGYALDVRLDLVRIPPENDCSSLSRTLYLLEERGYDCVLDEDVRDPARGGCSRMLIRPAAAHHRWRRHWAASTIAICTLPNRSSMCS